MLGGGGAAWPSSRLQPMQMRGGGRVVALLRHAARPATQHEAPGGGVTAVLLSRHSTAALTNSGHSACGAACGTGALQQLMAAGSRSSSAAGMHGAAGPCVRVAAQRGKRTKAAARKASAQGEAAAEQPGADAGAAASDAVAAAAKAPKPKRAPRKSKAKPGDNTPAELDPVSGGGDTDAAAAAAVPALSGRAAVPGKRKPAAKQTAAAKAKARAAAAEAASPLPPPRPPPDLSACVPGDAAPWAAVKQWVVFSDLHVSPRTVGVSVEVLRRVHEEAVARDAGILFLGECTNMLLEGLRHAPRSSCSFLPRPDFDGSNHRCS